jgi:hypothetical protein
MTKALARVVCMIGLASAASASQALDVRPLVKGGFDFGGDTIVTARFTDGSTRSIKANQGFYVGGGASVLNDDGTLEAELSLSYKMGLISANNGDLKFTRLPLEALGFYRWTHFRLGGGLTYHINPRLEGSGVASNVTHSFDNAAGFVLQGDYLFTPKFSVGARYTNIKYKQTNPSATFKGDGVGVTIGYRF